MPDRDSLSDPKGRARFTHVCIDCGALGYAGGYHDHGGDSAGDTIPLSSLPMVIRSFQTIETERDELRAENERMRHGYCDEAYILMVQALDVKALPKGRRRILTEQAVRMAKIGLSKGWPRYQMRDVERRAEDVLRAHAPEELSGSIDETNAPKET